MNPIVATILPAITFAAAIGVFALMCIALNAFFTKTKTGERIMDATPWFGWTETVQNEDDYTNFTIHPANYVRVPR